MADGSPEPFVGKRTSRSTKKSARKDKHKALKINTSIDGVSGKVDSTVFSPSSQGPPDLDGNEQMNQSKTSGDDLNGTVTNNGNGNEQMNQSKTSGGLQSGSGTSFTDGPSGPIYVSADALLSRFGAGIDLKKLVSDKDPQSSVLRNFKQLVNTFENGLKNLFELVIVAG